MENRVLHKHLQASAYGAETLNNQGASELRSIYMHDLYFVLLHSNHVHVEM